jgi:hypothetical protein
MCYVDQNVESKEHKARDRSSTVDRWTRISQDEMGMERGDEGVSQWER